MGGRITLVVPCIISPRNAGCCVRFAQRSKMKFFCFRGYPFRYSFFSVIFLRLTSFSSPIVLRRKIYADSYLPIFLRRHIYVDAYFLIYKSRQSVPVNSKVDLNILFDFLARICNDAMHGLKLKHT